MEVPLPFQYGHTERQGRRSEETFDVLKDLYNIKDLEDGVLLNFAK